MSLPLPKIVYPSLPQTPSAPAVNQVASGSLGAATYYFLVTWITLYGESLPCSEFSLAVAANHVPNVGPMSLPTPPTYATGWNIYAATAAGAETLQNSGPLALGASWQMPNTGLVAGAAYPQSWGATLLFEPQFGLPRMVPYSHREFVGQDSFSTAGARQSVIERVDNYLTFEMQSVLSGADVAAWDAFIAQALNNRVPFDYYPDRTAAVFTTYSLAGVNQMVVGYKAAGQYKISLKFRREMQQVTAPPGLSLPPIAPTRPIAFTTSSPGNFQVQHQLGYVPGYVSEPKLVGTLGDVIFQTNMWDDTYIYLIASDAGLSGLIWVN